MNSETGSIPVREVLARIGVSFRVLDWWLRHGYVVVADSKSGSGNHRGFTIDEVDDLARLADVYRTAKANGLVLSGETIGRIWTALQTGNTWAVTLTTQGFPDGPD
jgi:hypothetical protein